MLLTLAAGTLAGTVHVFSGPDHLAAVVPFAARNPGQGWKIGAMWGLGHGLGVAMVGALGLWARGWLDVERFSAGSEVAVGVLLVVLGVWSAVAPVHAHGGELHGHGPFAGHAHRGALGVGMLHGSAGVGHLFGVLPALALPTSLAIGYLAAYLVSAVASMSTFSWALAWLVARVGPGFSLHLRYVAAAAAVGVGVFWISSSVV